MPSFSTHYVFANKLVERIRQADADLELNVSALYYGTQGPDVLFSHRILPTMKGKCRRDIASKLHACDPSKLFYYMREYLNTQPCDKATVKSYIYGFICHYALDRITHPYVYALQKVITKATNAEKFPTFVVHNRIELTIDVLLLQRFLGVHDTTKFRTYSTLKADDALICEMSRMLAYVVPRTCGDPADACLYRQAFYDFITIQKLFTDEKGFIYPLFSAVQFPVKRFIGPAATSFLRSRNPDTEWDYLNKGHARWVIPAEPDKTSNKSFDDLFAEAEDFAVNVISNFDTADSVEAFDALTGSISFDTGARFDVPVELH